ncbi:MAG: hypothetical protein J7J14_04165 [Thermotogaceae bacterium]|nr:hypothetical protein [Thermotogaceae bacterium]
MFLLLVSTLMFPFRIVSTSRMDIIYQDGLERQAFELMKNGENIMKRVEGLLGIELKDRLKVYIVRNGDIANAYADPLDNVIVIYPNDLQPGDFIPSYNNWVDYVFSHEYTHILLGRNYERWLDVFRIFGDVVPPAIHNQHVPMYLHEGLATEVETKLNRGRLEDPIFNMIVEDIRKQKIDLKYGGATTHVHIPGGNPYVLGSSFLSFVEREFDWETIKRIIHNMREPFTRFSEAVEKACKKDFRDLTKRWLKHTPATHLEEFIKVDGNVRKPIFDSGKVYFMLKDDFGRSGIYTFDGENANPVILEPSIVDFSVKDGKLVFIKRLSTPEGYVNHVFTKEKNMVGENFVSVDWYSDRLIGVKQLENGLRNVVIFHNGGEETILEGSESFVPLQVTSDGEDAALLAKSKGAVDIFLLKDGKIYNLTNDKFTEAFPLLRNGVLTFSKEINGETHIFKVDLVTGEIEEFGEGVEATIYGKAILKTIFKNGRYRLFIDKKSKRVGKVALHETVVDTISDHGVSLRGVKTHVPVVPRLSLPIPGWFLTAFWDDLLRDVFISGSFITDKEKGLYIVYQHLQNTPASLSVLKTSEDLLFSGIVYFPTRLKTKQMWFSIGASYKDAFSLFTSLDVGKAGGRRHYTSFPELRLVVSSKPGVSLGEGFLIGKSLNFLEVDLSDPPSLEFLNVTPFLDLGWGFSDGWMLLDALDMTFSVKLGVKDTHFEGGFRLNTVVSYNFNIPLNFRIGIGKKGVYFKLDIGNLGLPFSHTMLPLLK